MKSQLLDTNAFLRFLLNDVPEQATQVNKLFVKAKSKEIEIFVPQIVIFEIEFALDKFYKFPKTEVVDRLGVLLLTPYIKIQDAGIFHEALALFNTRNIDFVDCFLLCQAKANNFSIFSFDRDLRKLMK
jgi:predicted nucleic-acid-binding protein